MTNAKRWKYQPEGSNWGDFGPDDQIGRLNLITPERRRAAVREVREGIVFALSLPLDYPKGERTESGWRGAPKLFSTPLGHNHKLWAGANDVVCDDAVTMTLQFSTQWDSLCHVGAMFDPLGTGTPIPCYYNGYRADEHVTGDPKGATTPHAHALAIETMAVTGVQGRGVLLDLFAVCGAPRAAVGYDTFMRALESQKVSVESGDILCLYTGLGDLIMSLGDDLTPEKIQTSCATLDGFDERLLKWIADSGLAAIASDNAGIENWTGNTEAPGGGILFPLHNLCLFKLGIPLGELWYLSELARWLKEHARNRFLLTAPPLRLPGAVGSPVTPVATV
jgi:kynurenine formamidase